MKLLLKIIIGFLAIVGFATIAAASYLYVADPWGLKPLLMPAKSNTAEFNQTNTNTTTNPLLTPGQASALQKLGIDPMKLPTTITPAMETCLVKALGQTRINEIKAGSLPTPMEVLRGKACL